MLARTRWHDAGVACCHRNGKSIFRATYRLIAFILGPTVSIPSSRRIPGVGRRVGAVPIHNDSETLRKGFVMSQDLTQIAREIVTTYSSSNWTGLKNLMTPDAIYNEVGTQRKIQGPDAIVQSLQEWKKAMTDSSGTVNNVFAADTNAVLQITWQGTHNGPFTGPFGTLQPTNKKQTTPAAMIVKFQGNKVKEIHHYFDMVTFL